MTPRYRWRLPALLVAGGLCLAPTPSQAQTEAPATLRVQLIDDMTGDPIEGAAVRMRNGPEATTGPTGRAEITGIAPGRWRVMLQAIGFEPRVEDIRLSPGQVYQHRYGLAFTGDQLDEIVVSARNERLVTRYADFHRRMSTGGGFFLTWDQISSRGYMTLGDALQRVRGVYVRCQTHDCVITMSRSRICEPAYWVDGIEGRSFATTIPIRDIYGVEVYRGSGEMPGEYAGTGGCGAIVIWTKNKPFR